MSIFFALYASQTDSNKLEESREVSHEILGMGYYALRGWYK